MPPLTPPRARRARPPAFNRSKHGRRPASPWWSGIATLPRGATGTHVARAGESLWSIARDMLGGTASTAQIAREVNRLWELNQDRIGTGDPDLLMVGTRLTLR